MQIQGGTLAPRDTSSIDDSIMGDGHEAANRLLMHDSASTGFDCHPCTKLKPQVDIMHDVLFGYAVSLLLPSCRNDQVLLDNIEA